MAGIHGEKKISEQNIDAIRRHIVYLYIICMVTLKRTHTLFGALRIGPQSVDRIRQYNLCVKIKIIGVQRIIITIFNYHECNALCTNLEANSTI